MTDKDVDMIASAVARCRSYHIMTRTENEEVIVLQADEIERLYNHLFDVHHCNCDSSRGLP